MTGAVGDGPVELSRRERDDFMVTAQLTDDEREAMAQVVRQELLEIRCAQAAAQAAVARRVPELLEPVDPDRLWTIGEIARMTGLPVYPDASDCPRPDGTYRTAVVFHTIGKAESMRLHLRPAGAVRVSI